MKASLQSLNPLKIGEMADLLINSNAEVLIEMQESLLQENYVLIFSIRRKLTKTARCKDATLYG